MEIIEIDKHSQLEEILGWYAQRAISISRKRLSAMKEHIKEKEALQEVGSAVNRWLYDSER